MERLLKLLRFKKGGGRKRLSRSHLPLVSGPSSAPASSFHNLDLQEALVLSPGNRNFGLSTPHTPLPRYSELLRSGHTSSHQFHNIASSHSHYTGTTPGPSHPTPYLTVYSGGPAYMTTYDSSSPGGCAYRGGGHFATGATYLGLGVLHVRYEVLPCSCCDAEVMVILPGPSVVFELI